MGKGYECHITFDRADGPRVDEMNRMVLLGWKYSQIDGDPVLGKKVFCYLTRHSEDEAHMWRAMESVVDLARRRGINPVRAKIEHIIYDQRY